MRVEFPFNMHQDVRNTLSNHTVSVFYFTRKDKGVLDMELEIHGYKQCLRSVLFFKISLGLSKYDLFLVQNFPFTSHDLVFSKLYIVLCTKVFSLFYLSINYHAVLFWLVHDIFYTSVLAAYLCSTLLFPNIDFFLPDCWRGHDPYWINFFFGC